jgi:tetratricopeptide (TPR) repeat protein
LLIIPDDKFAAHINRGFILSTLQDYQEALKAFNQALKINPKSGEAYQARGRCILN